ncbi:MAG: hypothetical protein IJQ96_05075 [Bacteroidales bacterium]|nr:hypothetical protein [Bacteroidales bacterium]
MRKNNLFVLLAAAMSAGTVFYSCNRFEEQLQPQEPQEQGTSAYTLKVKAEKGTATKALTDEGVTLKASWAAGDDVEVYNVGGDHLGTLVPAVSSTSSTTLSGNLTTAPAMDEVLTLKFRSNNYATQQGTLEYIAANCDYATAEVTVTAVSGNSIETTPAHFVSQQAIVKFTLRNSGDTGDLNVTQLLVNDGTNTYTITPVSATPSVLYVAIEGFSEQTVTMTANTGSAYYDRTKADVTFENGKFYRIKALMTQRTLKSISISGLEPVPMYYYGGALQINAR